MPRNRARDFSRRNRLITGLLGPTPVSIDDLVRLSRSSSPVIVRTVLLELEIAREAERFGGLVSLL